MSLIVIEGRFVIVGCGHWLQFEFYKLESGILKSQPETIFRKGIVGFIFSSHKPHWPPNYRRIDRCPKLAFSLFAQVAQNAGNQVFESHAPSENLGALKITAAEERLERLNEPPFGFSSQIALDTFRAGPRFKRVHPALFVVLQV